MFITDHCPCRRSAGQGRETQLLGKRSSQHPSSLRASGLFISPLEQLLTWSFEVATDLGETGALAVNWVPTKD